MATKDSSSNPLTSSSSTASASNTGGPPPVKSTYKRQAVHSDKAPKPNGNYSHVIKSGNILHVAGWMGDDPATGQIVEGGIEAQTVQAIKNIASCLEAAGSRLEKVLQRRIYIIDMKQFRAVDRIWAEWVGEPFPVSTCVQISGLAKEGALVELEVVAEQ